MPTTDPKTGKLFQPNPNPAPEPFCRMNLDGGFPCAVASTGHVNQTAYCPKHLPPYGIQYTPEEMRAFEIKRGIIAESRLPEHGHEFDARYPAGGPPYNPAGNPTYVTPGIHPYGAGASVDVALAATEAARKRAAADAIARLPVRN